MSADDLAKLLESARKAHEGRREYDAVRKLLEIELAAASGTARELGLLAELARVLDEELLDDAGAKAAYERLLARQSERLGRGRGPRPNQREARQVARSPRALRAGGRRGGRSGLP